MAPQKSCIALAKCSQKLTIFTTSKDECSGLHSPAPDVEPRRRRPKHVLYDHDDQITTDDVSQQHTNTQPTQRLHRRRRGPRFLTSAGHGYLPRSRGRSD
ncbi:jg2147 [Pararge aegeria aegeria]|uniref:Jg2147 protein n=1 Tax=Pararge aegeria aegeria TaxID=348720 RepID=A0A8S4RUE2_9NEOP|nr:jg2147 [Pararge aegeria aegeria]